MNVGENNTVTISVEEYRKLFEIQAIADATMQILSVSILNELQKLALESK